MAPIAGVLLDAYGRCTAVLVTLRTTSAVYDKTVFKVARTTPQFVFLEPEETSTELVPVSVQLPLAITTHLPFAPTLIMRTPPADTVPKKRRTLEVASLPLGHWRAAVTHAHDTQPRIVKPVAPLLPTASSHAPAAPAPVPVATAKPKKLPARAKHVVPEDSEEEEEMEDVAEAEVEMEDEEDTVLDERDECEDGDESCDAEEEEEEETGGSGSESDTPGEEDEFEEEEEAEQPVSKRFRIEPAK
jgi:hypothetical protein